MITLLIALHPKSWRARYGDEFRALLETQPLTVMVVLNVLGNAGRQHVGAHRTLLRVILAIAVSVGVEWVAVMAVYLVDRAVVEVIILEPTRPDSYQRDWGGPHYLGVMAVHAGPGLPVLIVAVLWVRRATRQRRLPGSSGYREVVSAAAHGPRELPESNR